MPHRGTKPSFRGLTTKVGFQQKQTFDGLPASPETLIEDAPSSDGERLPSAFDLPEAGSL
jgi:hypothetical protein